MPLRQISKIGRVVWFVPAIFFTWPTKCGLISQSGPMPDEQILHLAAAIDQQRICVRLQEIMRLPRLEVFHGGAIICRKRLTPIGFVGTLSLRRFDVQLAGAAPRRRGQRNAAKETRPVVHPRGSFS